LKGKKISKDSMCLAVIDIEKYSVLRTMYRVKNAFFKQQNFSTFFSKAHNRE